MAARTVRATMLGAAATTLLAAVTWGLLSTAVSAWPGSGAVQVDAGLGFLALGAAGLVAGWATVVLAAATTSLAASSRLLGVEGGQDESALGTGTRGVTGRIAAGLLVAASLGVAPATAAEAPRPAAVVAHELDATLADGHEPVTAQPAVRTQLSGTAVTSSVLAADEAVDDIPAPAEDVPVPRWTPTVTGAQALARAKGEVGLVSTAGSMTAQADEVVVRRGDTLWDIAARHLGEHATDQDIAEAWPRWYDANRDVIGADPDLIHPGQRLVAPTSEAAR